MSDTDEAPKAEAPVRSMCAATRFARIWRRKASMAR